MPVASGDWVPATSFNTDALDAPSIIGGVCTSTLVSGILSLFVVVSVVSSDDVSADDGATEIEEHEVVAARFVKLGRDFREELPNRNVPLKSTAPPDTTAISKVQRERREVPDAGPRPVDPMDDPLQRLVDRADLFAELAEEREREGNPEGIEEGTETEAQAGDLYAGQIYSFFRRGWSVPETIDADALRDLTVEVTIRVGEDLEIVSGTLRGSSGNADFDASVLGQIERLRLSDAMIPEPPILVRPTYVGNPFTLRFRGRHAARD
jgi:hypothetical protein